MANPLVPSPMAVEPQVLTPEEQLAQIGAQSMDPAQVEPSVPVQEQVNPALNLIGNNEIVRRATQLGVTVPQLVQEEARLQQQQTQSQAVKTAPLNEDNFDAPQIQQQNALQPVQSNSGAAGAIASSTDAAIRADKAAMDAAEIKGNAQAVEYEALNNKLQQQELQATEKRTQIETQVNDQLADFQKTSNEMKNFKFQDYWADRSTGQKVMAGIAIALGGIGGAFTGKGDNKALDIINQAIDRDINLQKLNFQKLGAQADQSKAMLGALNQKYGNQIQGEAAARAYAIQATQNRLASIAGQYESKELKSKYAVLNSQLEQQKQTQVAAFKQAAQMQAALGDLRNVDMRNLNDAQINAFSQTDKTFRDRYVPGYGPSVNHLAAQKFSEYRKEVEPALASIRRVQELSKNLTTLDRLSPVGTQRAREIETELVALVGNLRLPFTGPGQLLEQEYKRLRGVIGNPASAVSIFTNKAEQAAMTTVMKKLNTDLASQAKAANLQPNQAPMSEEEMKKLFPGAKLFGAKK